uniref:Uncharacterized protein n=1 Tax=Trichuris muris TaxID=70415 RepID=A0A5S6QT96_TRIMR
MRRRIVSLYCTTLWRRLSEDLSTWRRQERQGSGQKEAPASSPEYKAVRCFRKRKYPLWRGIGLQIRYSMSQKQEWLQLRVKVMPISGCLALSVCWISHRVKVKPYSETVNL